MVEFITNCDVRVLSWQQMPFDFVAWIEGIDETEAVRKLATQVGILE